MNKDDIDKITQLMGWEGRIARNEGDIDLAIKTEGNHIMEINRRLESMQQNAEKRDTQILKKIEDTITIALLKNNDVIDSKINNFNDEKIKPILYGRDGKVGLIDVVNNTASEIRFVKWLGYGFASIVTFIGFDKFVSTMKSLFS